MKARWQQYVLDPTSIGPCIRQDSRSTSPKTFSILLIERDLTQAINSFKPFKTPGPEGIIQAHLQQDVTLSCDWLVSTGLQLIK